MVESQFSKLIVAGSSPVPRSMERCPSGLRSNIGNVVCYKRHPGFESLSLREEEEWLSGL